MLDPWVPVLDMVCSFKLHTTINRSTDNQQRTPTLTSPRLRAVDPTTMATYIKNSLRIDSPQMQRICSAAAEHNIAVVLGFAEAQNASLYISQATISSTGELLMTRRKLKPTHLERTVFGDAGASCLHNVTPLNLASGSGGDAVNVGALSCWEHIQPLLKYHTYLQNEQLHVAAWPPLDPHPGPETPALWSMSREGCLSLSQTYAVESAAYVLHCTTVITQAGIEGMQTQQCMMFNVPGGGGSCVIGPDGRRMTGELKGEEEGIVYAELDMGKCMSNMKMPQ